MPHSTVEAVPYPDTDIVIAKPFQGRRGLQQALPPVDPTQTPCHPCIPLKSPVGVLKACLRFPANKTPSSILGPTISLQPIFSPDADPTSCPGEEYLCDFRSIRDTHHAQQLAIQEYLSSIHRVQFSRERPMSIWPCIVPAICQAKYGCGRVQLAAVEMLALGMDNTPTRVVAVGQSVRFYHTSCLELDGSPLQIVTPQLLAMLLMCFNLLPALSHI
jgi:hypothetical protein